MVAAVAQPGSILDVAASHARSLMTAADELYGVNQHLKFLRVPIYDIQSASDILSTGMQHTFNPVCAPNMHPVYCQLLPLPVMSVMALLHHAVLCMPCRYIPKLTKFYRRLQRATAAAARQAAALGTPAHTPLVFTPNQGTATNNVVLDQSCFSAHCQSHQQTVCSVLCSACMLCTIYMILPMP